MNETTQHDTQQGIYQEKEISDIHVVRYSWKDEREEDESYDPYNSRAQQGFDAFSGFIANLQKKYPDRNFPRQETLDVVSPSNPNSDTNDTNLVTYLTYKGDNDIVGGVLGKDEIGKLKAYWLAIDQEYQNRDAFKKLWQRLQEDYEEIELQARTFGYDDNLPPERQIHRQKALIKYYERLGFRIDEDNETYKRLRYIPGAQVPMIWKKNSAA